MNINKKIYIKKITKSKTNLQPTLYNAQYKQNNRTKTQIKTGKPTANSNATFPTDHPSVIYPAKWHEMQQRFRSAVLALTTHGGRAHMRKFAPCAHNIICSRNKEVSTAAVGGKVDRKVGGNCWASVGIRWRPSKRPF